MAHLSTMTTVALMVGSNRVISSGGITYPTGNSNLNPKAEKLLRRAIVERALEALQTDLTEQKLFYIDTDPMGDAASPAADERLTLP